MYIYKMNSFYVFYIVDGKLSAWSSWTSCSKSCDNGTQEHNRTCEFDKIAPIGNNCTGDLYEIRACNEEKCPSTTYLLFFFLKYCNPYPAGGIDLCLGDQCKPYISLLIRAVWS